MNRFLTNGEKKIIMKDNQTSLSPQTIGACSETEGNHLKKKRFWGWSTILALLLCGTLLLASCNRDGSKEDTAPILYTITFDSNGGSSVDAKQVAAGATIPKPTDPEKEGYLFGGWLKESGYEWNFGYETVNQNLTLKANWVSAESVFSYRKLEGADAAVITELKNQQLSVIHIPSVIAGWSVVGIDGEALSNLSEESVREVVLPKSITTVGDYAFANSDGISILFEDGCALTEIGERAFQNCDGLTRIPLGEGLETIPFEAFYGCGGLSEIRIPKSVTAIEENAFAKCSSLKAVMLYADLAEVQNMTFDDCDALRTVFFYGSADEADALLEQKVDRTNEALIEAAVYLYAPQKPAETGKYGYWYLADNGTAKVWQ